MKFGYTRYGSVLRPVIPITLRHGDAEVGYHVLVDSGADMCLFDEEIGAALGLPIRRGTMKTVFGVGGKSSVYYVHRVEVGVGGKFQEIEAGFMPNVAGNVMPYGLVGQAGFFDRFIVSFDLLRGEVQLKERK